MSAGFKKVVLAYSGGLDTSIIVRWLIETYKCEVICFAADLGQKEELTGLRKKQSIPAPVKYTLKIYGKNLPVTSCFRRSGLMPFMKASISWEPRWQDR